MPFKFGECPKCGSARIEVAHPTGGTTVFKCRDCQNQIVVGSAIERDDSGRPIKPRKGGK